MSQILRDEAGRPGRAQPAPEEGPLGLYRARRRAGLLEPDPAQAAAAEKLQSLHNALKGYRPAGRSGWRERLGLARRREDPPQGLYIFGGVGRGKSMLMDMFFECAPLERKRRVHFHRFMLEVHDSLHRRRQSGADGADALADIAAAIAETGWLLCFDEFQVRNIADAMLLGRLFAGLLDRGVVIVATSNTAPDALYEGGLQRELFLPFIALLKERLDLLELDGGTDYRRARLAGMTVYHQPLGAAAEAQLAEAFAALTEGAEVKPLTLTIQGRSLTVARAARGVAWFDFDALCRGALGAADYLALATQFHTLLLSRVPRLAPEERNEARRFITLIDALYEHKVKLICSAAALPGELYPQGEGARDFRRAASRLIEMQSPQYLARPHLA